MADLNVETRPCPCGKLAVLVPASLCVAVGGTHERYGGRAWLDWWCYGCGTGRRVEVPFGPKPPWGDPYKAAWERVNGEGRA